MSSPLQQQKELANELRDYQGATSADIPKKWYTETQATENGEHDVLLDVSTYWSHVGELKVLNIQNGSMVSVPRFPLLSKLSMALLSIHQRC